MAKRNGARLIIINREPTDFDDIADLVVRQDIGTVLAPFVDCTSSTDVHRL
jgi:NAD-dependent protein deacetylase/lipoamidase